MSDKNCVLPDAHFGEVGAAPSDWRRAPDGQDPDDEVVETPPDVVEMLGLDPTTLFD